MMPLTVLTRTLLILGALMAAILMIALLSGQTHSAWFDGALVAALAFRCGGEWGDARSWQHQRAEARSR